MSPMLIIVVIALIATIVLMGITQLCCKIQDEMMDREEAEYQKSKVTV